ncbi:MAG: choline dehydrogenase-like flavoprotein [Verrucomicrobiales bacterium]|jgi:choline dehydrogenase-like flavoprotein
MKRALIDFAKNWSSPILPDAADAEAPLTDAENRILCALYRLVTDCHDATDTAILELVKNRIQSDARYCPVYRETADMLELAATELGSTAFYKLSLDTQDKAVGLILKDYPHPDTEPTWKRTARFTGLAKEQLFASSKKKRVRNFVVREFLHHHYSGKTGWDLVGYDSRPGSPEEELAEVALEKVERRNHSIALQLSDGTVEAWSHDQFIKSSAKGVPERITVKSGRQVATVGENASGQWLKAATACAQDSSIGQKNRPTEVDCVIVGSGPVGAAAADVLVRAGLTVAMLESGDKPERDRFKVMARSLDNNVAWDFSPWEYEMHGDDLNLNTFAVRKLGGSSLAWGAVSPRFLENDFRLQSLYGVGKDWPLDYQGLSPDYLAAENFMGVSGHDDNPFLPKREAPLPMPGFEMSDSDLLVKMACERLNIQLHSIPTARNTQTYQGRSKCINYSLCRACPVGAMYSADQTVDRLREFDNFHLITQAHVRKVVTGSGDRIEAVRYHDAEGREHTLHAEHVIMAAQAIENVRILLNSSSKRFPNGVANGSGLLGKYLTEHMKFYIMGRVPHKLHPHLRGYETAASQQFQDHPDRHRAAGGRIIVRENAGPVPLDLATRSGKWGRALKDELTDTFGSFVTLGAFMEQLPYEDNHVDLSPTKKNAFGDPAARIHFELMRKYEKRGYRMMKKILTDILRELDAEDVREIMPPSVGGHYMCVHRMGDSIEDSVVDSHCETHDVHNLYLAGSGSFTTGGVSNPTLTGVALALRTARRITEKASAPASADAIRQLATASC